MDGVVVNADNADQWRRPIHEFARDLDLYWRCNASGVAQENWEATYPSEDLVQDFIDEGFVMVIDDDGWVRGYVLVSKLGNGLIKWAGIDPMHQDKWDLLILGVRTKFGQVWGRVENDAMRESLLANVDGLAPRDGEPLVVGIWE